ncbi:16S rRNA (guanine1516-N2)-methyltransferase [Marinobacterium lutimaris]|uniref:Ribosomal RNA small subunit methyltransferase J n=2 Tax=Marinobacterium lutimaris TaxID=568106 RepID=A0A1H6CGV3_9GAMM|nr:16S rRNA (guanine1516-N2)-methyltransferase [Marinobacterium lutimaris]
MNALPVVGTSCAARSKEACELARELGLVFAEEVDLESASVAQYLLLTEDALVLQQTGRKRPGPVLADFVSGAVAHRRQFGGGKGQMIAKACGIKGSIRPTVADVTAGLGRDGFVLATLGCEVSLVERSPVVHALLADGLARAADSEVADIIARMRLYGGDARDWLSSLAEAERPQVVHLDPMFPHSDKSAQVKKEMLAFRDLVGEDADQAELLAVALEVAECRVVVKRPRKAPSIGGREPSYKLEGKSGRYDIYALKKLD